MLLYLFKKSFLSYMWGKGFTLKYNGLPCHVHVEYALLMFAVWVLTSPTRESSGHGTAGSEELRC